MRNIFKKGVSMILAYLLFVGISTFALADAADFTFDPATGTITGYGGSGGDVQIPDEIDGVAVTGISQAVFHGNMSITEVAIPGSVTSIADRAFENCTNLTEFRVAADNTAYSSDENGLLFNKDKTILICYPQGHRTGHVKGSSQLWDAGP